MSWNVYIVETATGNLYTGIATDVERRVRQHNGELPGGAKCLRGQRPVKLVWRSGAFDYVFMALQTEAHIKRMTHEQKCAFIERTNKERS